MANPAESAVGAILHIDDSLLEKIDKAETKIKGLAKASEEAANAVSKHWGTIATSGLDTFIQKLADAQKAMEGLGTINVTLNTQAAVRSTEQLSVASQKASDDVSKSVQNMAQTWTEFAEKNSRQGLNLFSQDLNSVEKMETALKSLKEKRDALVENERGAAGFQKSTLGFSRQELNDQIAALEQMIKLLRQSNEAARKASDAQILAEQKTLLQQILQYQKDINAETVRQERATKLGGTIPPEDIDRLRDYKERLDKLSESYTNLKTKVDEMSAAGQKAFNAVDVKHTLAMSREQTATDEKRGQALQMVSKYLSDIKLKSAGISSREEGIYMNEQVGVYRQMIDLIKRRGEVEAQVASQGYAQTSAQTNLLQTISNEYARLEASLTNVTGKYTEIDRAVSSAFDKAKTMQEAENAAKLADAYQKAAEAAEKKRKAESKTEQTDLSKDKAEYKRVLTLIEQIEKAWRKVNDALANTTLPTNLAQQLQSSQAAAEATLNNLYNRRAELEAKRGQELVDIQQQNEAKKGAAAVAEHEKAEKEKTRISRQEATDRYNEEMRLARLHNQALTAQGKQQRMTINDAREQRAIELTEQRKREVERLRQEIDRLDKLDANYQKDLDRLNQRINELLGTSSKRISYTREEAMAMAKSASTLREYENAYKALKDAMATTNPKDKKKEWEEMNSQLQKTKTHIDEIKKAMGELRSESSKTSSLMGGLKDKIAAAFSVAAVQGFIKKMVEVRAQFELQRVALGAIIQDRDEANKIFTQVQNMALESPFSIMQLEKATKQIAAFGFETQKLVPTMKMFADISAGLGVEIDRLVLVMGHLKARNFLEGTMVRQFTNMGFNVLGNLAKYYSEIEDRLVSVGEVQERVKKKMISFEDVEEVLKRVTSAGGMFYDMQKKQSDSLWGQMQRIQDAYDLMLNSIGQSNEGVIKSALSAIRSLINHWRILAPIIKDLGYAMAAVFAARGVTMLLSGFTALGGVLLKIPTYLKSIVAGIKAMNLAWSTTGLGALVAIGLTAWEVFRGIRAESEKLNDEFRRIGEDMTNSLNESISTFAQLTKTINDPSSTYTERAEAMTEMRRVYADILPQEKLEIEYIRSLNGDYTELTKTIQEYYQQKEYQQKMEALQASDQAVALTKQWDETLQEMNERGLFDLKYSKTQIKSWADTLSKEMMSGKLHASVEALDKRIKEVFDAKDLSKFWDDIGSTADIQDVLQAYQKLVDAEGDITIETANAKNALASYSKQIERLDITQLEKAKETLQAQADTLEKQIAYHEASAKGLGLDPESQKEVQGRVEQLQSVRREMEALEKAQAKWLSSKFSQEVESRTKSLTDQVRAFWTAKNAMEKLEMQGKSNTKEWEKQKYAMEKAKESADEVAATFGTTVDWALIKADKTTFELNGHLDDLAAKAFPKVAQMAAQSMEGLVKYLLQGKEKTLGWLKDIMELVPEKVRSAIPGFASLLGAVDEKLALTQEELDNIGRAADSAGASAEKAGDRISEIVSAQAIKHVDNFGANISDIDNIIKDNTKGVSDMAKELRGSADRWEKDVERFNTAPDKEVFLEVNNLTREQIDLFDKNAKAARALAADIDGVSKKDKGTKGKDEIAERWKNRLKAIQDFYKRYEELRQHFDETESLQRATDAFKGLFKVLDINMEDVISKGMGKQGLADNIKSMLDVVRLIRPKLADEFEKAFADVQIQVDFKVREDAEKEVQSQIDGMFDNYELTEELKKLGLNVDLVFMLGGEPMDLNDLKAKLRKGFEDAGGEAAPENIVKEYKDRLAKIADLELKQRKERIKEYNKYFVKTVGERAQIELEYLKKMDDVRKMYEFTDAQRQDALRQLTEEKNKKLADQVWKDFKDGEVYQMIFKDLDNISESALVTMRTELERIRDSFKGLSPKDLKEINKAITNIDEQIVNRNPFKALGKSFKDLSKYAKERKKNEEDFQKAVKRSGELTDKIAEKEAQLSRLRGKSSLYKVDQINEEIVNLNKQIAELEKDGVTSEEEAKINALKEQIRLLEEKKKKLEEIAALNQKEEDSMHSQIKGLESEVSGLNVELGKSNAKAEGAGKALSNGSVKAAAIQAAFQQIKQYAQETVSHIDGIIKGLDRMGLLSDAAKDNWESFMDGFEAMNDIAEGGINTMTGYMTGNYAQMVNGILQGIKGTINFIASIFEVGDKKKERQIKKLTEKVETLDKAYQKLEKSIEAAYRFDDYNAGYSQMQKNLDAQKTAYEEMIRLEEAKKKTDKNKIKEYKSKLEEIADAQDELRKQRHEMYGSTDDVWSEANNWVDAWLDVFKEYGTGLDSLNDSWDEFYENLVKKQATSAIVSRRMEGFINEINKAIDENLTEYGYVDAFKDIGERFKKEFGSMNQQLIDFFNYAGITGGNGELILSDLQKGIQNITEPQAAAIEAYLNSMRFAVFRHTEQLDTLIAAIQTQYGSGAENPVVTELKGIRGVLDSIDRRLGSVIKSNAGKTYVQVG